MTWPRALTALHVRVPAMFLGILVVLGAIYTIWLNHYARFPPAAHTVAQALVVGTLCLCCY